MCSIDCLSREPRNDARLLLTNKEGRVKVFRFEPSLYEKGLKIFEKSLKMERI